MAVYRYTYEVVGRVEFPMDMLRYDGAHPARSEDAAAIYHSFFSNDGKTAGEAQGSAPRGEDNKAVRVRLIGIRPPTQARWGSFVWSVDVGTLKKEKVTA